MDGEFDAVRASRLRLIALKWSTSGSKQETEKAHLDPTSFAVSAAIPRLAVRSS
jgi:hypothetical protein